MVIERSLLQTLFILTLIGLTGQPQYVDLYEYNHLLPLNPDVTLFKETGSYKAYKVYYDSLNGERVPALLIIPKGGNPPYPCIVFLHGYGGKKEDALGLADYVAGEGYAVFSIDAQYHGERKKPGEALYSPDIEKSVKGLMQTVLDLRRGIDFLETVPEIDKDKIGYVGGSMGGIIGGIFIGVEPRVKAAVLVVPGGNMSLMIRESMHPAIPPIREHLKKIGMSYEELQRIMDPVDPINFIHLFAPRPVQFHCGKHDKIVPAEAGRQLYEKAGEPKEIYWYDSGHDVPIDLVAARALDFLDTHLKGNRPLISRELLLMLYKNMHWIIAATVLAVAAVMLFVIARYRKRKR